MINLSNYDPSFINKFGNFLGKPLSKIIKFNLAASNSLLFTPTNKTTTLSIFVTNLLIFPAFIMSKLGNCVTYLGSSRISLKGLKIAPEPLVLPDPAKVSHLSLSEIPSSLHPTSGEDREGLIRMCSLINDPTQLHDGYRTKKPLFDEVSLYLKYIKIKLDNDEVSLEEKDTILDDLNKAGYLCYPTWLEVARKHYDHLYNYNSVSVSGKLIKLACLYKEEVILDYIQKNQTGRHWNLLNEVRNTSLRIKFGLTTDPNYDPNTIKWSFFQKIKWDLALSHKFRKVNQFVLGIQNKINLEPITDPAFHNELVKIIKERKNPNPEDFVAQQFYTDFKINFRGVSLLLKQSKLIV